VDDELKEMADNWLETARDYAENVIFLEDDPCSNALEYFNEISFEVFKPSDSLTGILFTDLGYNGGTHGYRVYQALNFDLKTGDFVQLTDLFPDPDKSLTEFFNVIYEDICDTPEPKHQTLPHFYGGVRCRKDQDKPKPPKEFLAKVDSLENLGNLVLTAKGATVNIGPHSAWSWAEGPYILQIPKEKLLHMGGNKALWENEAKTAAHLAPPEEKTELKAEMSKSSQNDPVPAEPGETPATQSVQSVQNVQSVQDQQANRKAESPAGEAS
jgi:hypothetical protein